MNTQDRSRILTQFISRIDEATAPKESSRFADELSQLQLNEDNLPQLDVVDELMEYHRDITGTIDKTYREVKDVMVQMKELKNRKKNVQVIMDSMTAIVEIKRLSYGLGTDPKEISANIQTYYLIKGKVYHMDKFIERIQKQIKDIEKEYQTVFDAEMAKNNSSSITEISKVLQLIRSSTGESNKPNTLQQITNFCVGSANKEFKEIQQALFAIPIVGNNESNYLFFDLAKTAMKVIVTISNNGKNNVLKVSGEEGLIHILKTLFELVTSGIMFELLMRLKKYYQIDKIVINKEKLVLRQKQVKQLQPYIKQYTAIWNQLERLRIHLLSQINQTNPAKLDLKLTFENNLNNAQLVQLNANIIIFMQALMRNKIQKLVNTSKFFKSLCNLEPEFFKEINKNNIGHNTHVHQFLEETINRISEGLEKGLETLNMLIISALINFTNHNLIFEDIFYVFNELFTRSFNKLPSNDSKVHFSLLLTLNAISAFPREMKMLLHIKLPEQVPEARIKVQIEEVINNNQRKALEILQTLIDKIVGAEWFRFQLTKDYQKNLQKWLGLQPQFFHQFTQGVCRTHAELILETQFSKKYTQVSAINFEKEVRNIITFYQGYSHDILPNFKKILDYLQVLQLQGEDDFKDIVRRFSSLYEQNELKKIWALRS